MKTKVVSAIAAFGLGVPATAAADPPAASPIAAEASCVAWFTTTLAHAGVIGQVVADGAQTLRPFGNHVSQQAAGERGSCPNNPYWFLP